MTTMLTEDVLTTMRKRRSAGEAVRILADELGLPWQKLDKALRNGLPKYDRGGKSITPPAPAEPPLTIQPTQESTVLTEKYRPLTLDAILGQPQVVKYLKSVVLMKTPSALLFSGDTGTGKTSAALALASALGCDLAHHEFGGVWIIASGEQSADNVREMHEKMWMKPAMGSGWKTLIINEADRMHPQAETIWLDRLEHIPPKTVIVFTTNLPEKLSRRFKDRCIHLSFTAQASVLRPDVERLLTAVWRQDIGTEPDRKEIKRIADEATEQGALSFRRALQLLQAKVLSR